MMKQSVKTSVAFAAIVLLSYPVAAQCLWTCVNDVESEFWIDIVPGGPPNFDCTWYPDERGKYLWNDHGVVAPWQATGPVNRLTFEDEYMCNQACEYDPGLLHHMESQGFELYNGPVESKSGGFVQSGHCQPESGNLANYN